MNGATTEPFASTSSPPRPRLTTMIGSIQYLRRAPRNRHICSTKSIEVLLEHVAEAVVRRSRRLAIDPLAARLRRVRALHGVAAEPAHRHPHRREHAVENRAEDERTHYMVEELAELHPRTLERREPVRAQHGDCCSQCRER